MYNACKCCLYIVAILDRLYMHATAYAEHMAIVSLADQMV